MEKSHIIAYDQKLTKLAKKFKNEIHSFRSHSLESYKIPEIVEY